jgi:hypothetical protein
MLLVWVETRLLCLMAYSTLLFQRRKHTRNVIYVVLRSYFLLCGVNWERRGSHSGIYGKCRLLWCDVVLSCRNVPTFRRNLLTPSPTTCCSYRCKTSIRPHGGISVDKLFRSVKPTCFLPYCRIDRLHKSLILLCISAQCNILCLIRRWLR